MSSYNFLGLVNDVNNLLNEVELTQTNFSSAVGFYSAAKNAVNSAIREINQQQFEWPFNHDTQREYLIEGEVRYYIPRDVKTLDMDSFRIIRDTSLNNETVRLKLISYEDYLDRYLDYEYNTASNLRSLPKYVFRTPSLEYGVVPPPDKAYPIAYEYYRSPVDLSLYSDVPSIPEDFRYVIVNGALVHTHTFRGDNESSQLSLQKFNAGIKDMRTLYINRYEYIRSTVRNQ
jgi:hypothetical protein